MATVHQVLSSPDLEEVLTYANKRLAISTPDEHDRMFKSWSVKWRREALEHYLRLGWSFIAREEETPKDTNAPSASSGPSAPSGPKTVGFFLAQPFLFFRGQTQTLWVEHIEADSDAIRKELVDIAVKVAREKHLQRVIFSDAKELGHDLAPWIPEPLELDIAVVKTTKG